MIEKIKDIINDNWGKIKDIINDNWGKIIIVILIISIIILLYYKTLIYDNYYSYLNSSIKLKDNIYISLTTIPERLIDPWFYNNLLHLMNLNGNYKVILNIPYHYKKNNEKYIIPDNIRELKKKKLIINRIKEDYGPLTKLYGPLLNDDISDNSAILICDDDIVYNKDFITIIYNKYKTDKNKLYTYCSNRIEGFKGFMVQKKRIKSILNFRRPDSCFRIDDNFIEWGVKKLNIEVISVPYNGDTSWDCSFDRAKTDTHPKWSELNFDNRKSMIKKCLYDLNKLNI